MQHPELGRRILDRVADAVAHVGRVEIYPKTEGRNMTMMLSPGQATRRQREEALAHQASEEAAALSEKTAVLSEDSILSDTGVSDGLLVEDGLENKEAVDAEKVDGDNETTSGTG